MKPQQPHKQVSIHKNLDYAKLNLRGQKQIPLQILFGCIAYTFYKHLWFLLDSQNRKIIEFFKILHIDKERTTSGSLK